MSNQTALAIIAGNTGTTEEEVTEVIKGMIISAKNQRGSQVTNAEFAVVTGTCAKYGLNPLMKEVVAFVSGGKLQIIIPVDGWYKMVTRQSNFDGVEFEDNMGENGKLISITCKMYAKDVARPISVTEYMNECFDNKSSVWRRWPNRMLRHKAYIQTARMAFGISEVLDDDERNRIDSNSNGQQSQPRSQPQQVQTVAPVDFDEINTQMAECGDMESLNAACVEIKSALLKTNQWKESAAKCSEIKVTHEKRIDALDNIEEAVFEEVIEEAADVPFSKGE